MKIVLKLLCLCLLLGSTSFAKNVKMFFGKCGGDLCASPVDMSSARVKADGSVSVGSLFSSVRVMIVDPAEDGSAFFGARLDRPVFILDGIYLSTDEVRTVEDFYEDTKEFGIPEMLVNMGYTPVLVQFSETVGKSVSTNAKNFRELLKFFNSNNLVAFPNAMNDGYVVLGISQGGIIGRYGAYLYDKQRKKTDAPIRMFASLDSPHQGAVMPKGLLETIDFWAKKGGSADAEAFGDLISAPGASDLLLRQASANNEVVTDSSRFLFGEYRKACEYKGFPAVLVSQGQMKGKSPKHNDELFKLKREASYNGSVYGRVISRIYSKNSTKAQVSRNYMYKFMDGTKEEDGEGNSKLDFIQGSTYPFAKTMYKALRSGFEKEMPNKLNTKIVGPFSITLSSKWAEDSLLEPVSTFIPTASAMDLKCSGDLAIRHSCSYSVNSDGFPFENPGSRSSAMKVYAVDSSHPRYSTEMSGRHIESPILHDGSIDSLVLRGMQRDIWRIVCEMAKVDYDSASGTFRNPYLVGIVSPNTKCMDPSKIPDVISNGGILQKTAFPYARYAYNTKASEKNDEVSFTLPSGWQKVALFDNGGEIPANSIFEVKVKVESPKSNWMKAELILQRTKGGTGVQMSEVSVTQDGDFQTIRWQMPSTAGVLANYRWFRLVLNSAGAKVTIASPRLVRSAVNTLTVPSAINAPNVLPSKYSIVPWSSNVNVSDFSDKLGAGVSFEFTKAFDGAYVDLGKMVSMNKYSSLDVTYWPGTCQKTRMYFDSKNIREANLAGGESKNGFVTKKLRLSDVIYTDMTPNSSFSAHRLNLQGTVPGERCLIKSIILK